MQVKRLPIEYHASSEAYFRCLSHLPGCVWLDSGKERSASARYDILTALPRQTYSYHNGATEVTNRDGTGSRQSRPILEVIEERLQAYQQQCPDLPFAGGVVGYLGYESLHRTFGLATHSTGVPADAYYGLYDWALIQDHHTQQSTVCHWDDCPSAVLDQLKSALDRGPQPLTAFACSGLSPDTSKAEYLEAVNKIKNYIHAGDCYQVNYAQRFSGQFHGSASACYLHLRDALPGPFSAFLETPLGSVLSLSPERFLSVDQRHVETQPIKGTAPRHANPELDTELANELATSEKNRAENLMIVDLLRNDLSKVCETFSVKVPELFGLQSFRNVHHLVSTVTGTLESGKTLFDLLKACFPGGSITGAPKKRAMEIIQELETQPRGIYCGSLMYISTNGRMDSNIAIRTLVQTEGDIRCWGGGGIVADSDPALEYQESLHKVGVLLDALSHLTET